MSEREVGRPDGKCFGGYRCLWSSNVRWSPYLAQSKPYMKRKSPTGNGRALNSVVACSLLPNNSLLGPMSTAAGFCGNKLTNDRRSLSVSNSGTGEPLDVRSLLGINLQNVVEPPLQQISLLGL